ncbi:MAG: hypothetical protein WEB13_10145 [Dehalococcoidia bacterium]
MAEQGRSRRIEPAEPGGEAICLLSAEGAGHRRVPIDRLLEHGEFVATANGYEARLPRTEDAWRLANMFVEEEAACCPSFAFEVHEREGAVVMLAGHPDVGG